MTGIAARPVGAARRAVGILRSRRRRNAFAFLKDYRRALPYLQPHRGLAGASLGLVVACSAASLLAPWPLAILIDTVLGHKPLPSLLGPLDGLSRDTLLVLAVVAGLFITA